MASRIRYIPHPTRDNVVESTQIFTSSRTGAEYLVRLDFNTMQYEVKNINSEVIYRPKKSVNNMNVLKRNAKKKLESLGVEFNSEDRNRTFGRCEKGYTQKQHLEDRDERLG
jgi:hypothetical protein